MGSITAPQKGSNYDEIFMQRSLQFAESLKVPIYLLLQKNWIFIDDL